MTWASELFEKEERIYINTKEPCLRFVKIKDLVLAVLEKNKEVEELYKNVKPIIHPVCHSLKVSDQARAWRELVQQVEKVKE